MEIRIKSQMDGHLRNSNIQTAAFNLRIELLYYHFDTISYMIETDICIVLTSGIWEWCD